MMNDEEMRGSAAVWLLVRVCDCWNMSSRRRDAV